MGAMSGRGCHPMVPCNAQLCLLNMAIAVGRSGIPCGAQAASVGVVLLAMRCTTKPLVPSRMRCAYASSLGLAT